MTKSAEGNMACWSKDATLGVPTFGGYDYIYCCTMTQSGCLRPAAVRNWLCPLTVSFFDGVVGFVQIQGGTFALGPSDKNGRWPVQSVAMLVPDTANGYVCYPHVKNGNPTVECDLDGKWVGYAGVAVMSVPCEWMTQVSDREWPPIHCAGLQRVPSV